MDVNTKRWGEKADKKKQEQWHYVKCRSERDMSMAWMVECLNDIINQVHSMERFFHGTFMPWQLQLQ